MVEVAVAAAEEAAEGVRRAALLYAPCAPGPPPSFGPITEPPPLGGVTEPLPTPLSHLPAVSAIEVVGADLVGCISRASLNLWHESRLRTESGDVVVTEPRGRDDEAWLTERRVMMGVIVAVVLRPVLSDVSSLLPSSMLTSTTDTRFGIAFGAAALIDIIVDCGGCCCCCLPPVAAVSWEFDAEYLRTRFVVRLATVEACRPLCTLL